MSSVTVEINGKETVSAAAAAAGGSIKKMGDDSKGIFDNLVITAGDVKNAIVAVANQVGEFFTEYAAQERSVMAFNAAVEQSTQLTTGSAERLKQYAGAMALKTGADDEDILSMIAYLATAGRTEEQIQKIIAASASMSVVTGDLRGNVENINKTFSGSIGLMGRNITELQGLTKEQLAAGVGVDVIGKKYGTLADELAGSSSVALSNFGNQWEDTKAALGEAFMPTILPILQQITVFLTDTAIPAIQGFQPIVSEVFSTIKGVVEFLGPALPLIGGVVGAFVAYEAALKIASIAQAAFNLVANMNPIGLIVVAVTALVAGLILLVDNWDTVKASLGKGWDAITDAWGRVWTGLQNAVKGPIDAIKGFFAPILEAVTTVINGIKTAVSWISGSPSYKPTTNARGQAIGPSGQLLSTNAQGYPVDPSTGMIYKDGKWGRYASGTSGAKAGWALVGEKGPEVVYFHGGETVIPNHKIGGYAAGTLRDADLFGGGGDSAVMGIFADLIKQIAPLAKSLGMVAALFDYAGTILAGAMDVLGPLIDTILQPLVGVLRIVGQTIGSVIAPLLSILGPIITALANTFVWLYNNVFRHIGNGLIFIFNGMYNAFAGFVNGLSGLIKIITFGAVNLGRVATRDDREGFLERIDLGTVTSASGAGTTGSSATYERPRDITINVSVETSALVGSGGITEFAMILRREFASLGVLNMGAA